MSSYGISLRTTYDIRHGIAKILSLKFFRSPAVPSLLGISLKTAYDVTHELSKISSLEFLKSLAFLSLYGIYLRTTSEIYVRTAHGLDLNIGITGEILKS